MRNRTLQQFLILISPIFWSLENEFRRQRGRFFRKVLIYGSTSALFILLFTKLLSLGMRELQSLSPDVFTILLTKGYSLIFLIIFSLQIINGLVIALTVFYQSKDLELLFTAPVGKVPLFFSRLIETHLKTSWMLVIFGIPLLISLGFLFETNPLYYPYSFLLIMIFSVIPVNTGIAATILLSCFLQISRLRKLILSVGAIAGVVIITLLRLFRPERFVNPEFFPNLTIFLSELRAPSFILLPSTWISESIFHFLRGRYAETVIFISLLLLTSYVTGLLLFGVYRRFYSRGWHLLQGGGTASKGKDSKRGILRTVWGRRLPFINSQTFSFLRKDLSYQVRDVKNIQQNLVLLSLIVVYLFSISALPLNWLGFGVKLKYVISFFNTGLILIIIASLCSKLVYPVFVCEGKYLWIMMVSPMTARKFVWTKFAVLLLPVLLFGLVITIFSSSFIKVDWFIFSLNMLTTTLLSFTLVALVLYFSISDLRALMGETEREAMSTGNPLYMITAVFFVLITVLIEMVPLYLFFLREAVQVEFTLRAWFLTGGVVSALLAINLVTISLAVRLSVKKLDSIRYG
jgi:ABC-2 type transport system permease protein